MEEALVRKHLSILSSHETRGWHSPFSAVLRNLRRARIVAECENEAAKLGYGGIVLYDANENYLLEWLVGEEVV